MLEFNPFSLIGKTIIITGASSGIGRQCAIDCSRMGASIVLVARDLNRINETMMNMVGTGHIPVVADLNSISSNFIEEIIERTRCSIDGFIHCAGIEMTKPLKFTKIEDYEILMRTNAYSAFEMIRQLASKKFLSSDASIVIISSLSSIIARQGLTAYAASKGAINSAIKVMAKEFARRNIRVNAISPGTILTPMMIQAFESMTEEQQKNRINSFPLGLGKPEDISYACVYLLSNASRWITGQNIIIDGGYTLK